MSNAEKLSPAEQNKPGDSPAKTLFSYLEKIIYRPSEASLDISALPEEFRDLGAGLQYFAECINELRDFSGAIAKGELGVALPSRDNELAAPLKALHAGLRHMTWQSQQVARGDYQQRVEFMGEFADAFNEMTCQLAERQRALEEEIEKGREQMQALEQSNSLFEVITDETSLWIFVLDRETMEPLFENGAAARALREDSEYSAQLKSWFDGMREQEVSGGELCIRLEGSEPLYLNAKIYQITWRSQKATAYVVRDITEEKIHTQELESFAYRDNLTNLSNRLFGMEVFSQWLLEHRCFSVCFVDIDNLKYVNDTFGHGEGDTYILSVAEMLASFHPDAVVSRIGGDEFMLLTPDMGHEETDARMAALVEEYIARAAENPYLADVFSVSYGVVAVESECNLTASELLFIADERMYENKRANKAQRQRETLEVQPSPENDAQNF